MLRILSYRIVYDDEDAEWLNITKESNRVLVDDQILQITDSMKIHLGMPLDGYTNAVSDVVVARCSIVLCFVSGPHVQQ